MVFSTGRLVICTGTGNNGNQPLHEGGILKQGQTRQIELSVSSREPTLNVQLWKSYENRIEKFIKYGTLSEVTREIVTELIEKIVVNGDKSIDIVFKYQSPYPVEKRAV